MGGSGVIQLDCWGNGTGILECNNDITRDNTIELLEYWILPIYDGDNKWRRKLVSYGHRNLYENRDQLCDCQHYIYSYFDNPGHSKLP